MYQNIKKKEFAILNINLYGNEHVFSDFLKFGEKIDCLYQVLLKLPLLYQLLPRYNC